MQSMRLTREIWNPHTREDRDLVRKEMEGLLSSPHFISSKRYPAFLRYIVEMQLAGNGDSLKERTVGVEVFHRQPNYDTSIDTVVRVAAGEVRRRLEVFYHESELEHSVQISLPAGSYIPKFLRVSASDSEQNEQTQVALAETPAHVEPQEAVKSRPFLQRFQWLISVLLVAAVGMWSAFHFFSEGHETTLEQFWKPFEASSAPVLICTGTVVFSPADLRSPVPATRSDNYPYLSLGTARALSNVTELFGRLHLSYIAQAAPNVDLTELRAQPVILIGAYTNSWTLQLTDNLRYHFAPQPSNEIVDASNPAVHWTGTHGVPYSDGSSDFSLVARYRDPVTNSMTLVLAGLGINGTMAASAFVTSPQFVDALKSALPKDWENKNFELVLQSKVIQNEPGPPSIVAAYAW